MARITQKTIRHIEGVADQLNLTSDDAWTLRRCAMTLHRWHEGECGDSNDYTSWCITRDEKGIPYREVCSHTGGKNRMIRIRDMESGALRRIKSICAANGLHYYVQTDPRGGTLYLSRTPIDDQNYTHATFLA